MDNRLYINIKGRRKELGITQEELAKRLGYADKSMISRIERGLIDLPESKINEFAEALNVEPAWLLGYVNKKHPGSIIDFCDSAEKATTLIEYYNLLSDPDKDALLMYAEFLARK